MRVDGAAGARRDAPHVARDRSGVDTDLRPDGVCHDEGWTMRAQDAGQGTSAAAHHSPRQVRFWSAVGYSMMVLGTIGALLLMRGYGERRMAPLAAPVASSVAATAQPAQVLVHVLVALAAVIITGQLLAKLCASLWQPPVIGEVVAGMLLGPSLLGPELSGWILPPAVAPFLGLIAQLGVILYMFLVGLDSISAGSHTACMPPWPPPTRASSCPSFSARYWPWACTRGSLTAACRSPASRSSWAWPCRSLPSPCWRGSSPTAA
jgi:hypothetical protein